MRMRTLRALLVLSATLCACGPAADPVDAEFTRLVLRMKDGVAGGSDAFVTPDVKTFLDAHAADPALTADRDRLTRMRDHLLAARSTELIPENLAIVSHLLRSFGDDASVREAVKRAAAADPTRFAPPYVLGRLAQDAGDHDGAIAWFTRACVAAPGRPDGYARLGDALADAGRFDEALLAYDGSLARAHDADVVRARDAVKAKLAGTAK